MYDVHHYFFEVQFSAYHGLLFVYFFFLLYCIVLYYLFIKKIIIIIIITNYNFISESVCKSEVQEYNIIFHSKYNHLSESVCKCGTKIMTQCLILNNIKISLQNDDIMSHSK